jgi:exonuclease III
MNKHTIIQWNCRSFKSNYDEVHLLLQEYNPVAVCLQETFLKESDTISIKNYNMYNTFSANGDRAIGGASIIVNGHTPHSQVRLTTNLQAVAVRITLHKTITICDCD